MSLGYWIQSLYMSIRIASSVPDPFAVGISLHQDRLWSLIKTCHGQKFSAQGLGLSPLFTHDVVLLESPSRDLHLTGAVCCQV